MFVAGGGSWFAGTGSDRARRDAAQLVCGRGCASSTGEEAEEHEHEEARASMFVADVEEAVLLRVLQVPSCSSPASGAAVDLQAMAPAASPPTFPMSCQPPPWITSSAMAGARARKG